MGSQSPRAAVLGEGNPAADTPPHPRHSSLASLQRDYWNNPANKRTSIKRTLVHMLSAQQTGGGELNPYGALATRLGLRRPGLAPGRQHASGPGPPAASHLPQGLLTSERSAAHTRALTSNRMLPIMASLGELRDSSTGLATR